MKIKIGPITAQYKGTVKIQEADEANHTVAMRAQAKDARGQGTAAATITSTMEEIAGRHEGQGRDRHARHRPGRPVRPRRDAGRLREADEALRRLPGRAAQRRRRGGGRRAEADARRRPRPRRDRSPRPRGRPRRAERLQRRLEPPRPSREAARARPRAPRARRSAERRRSARRRRPRTSSTSARPAATRCSSARSRWSARVAALLILCASSAVDAEPELQAILDALPDDGPPAHEVPIEQARAGAHDRDEGARGRGRRRSTTSSDDEIAGVPVRVYEPAARAAPSPTCTAAAG